MTISSETRKAGPFTGNDVTDTFAFTFKIFAESDIVAVTADGDGVETTLTLTTDYTVSMNADQDADPGGDVVLNTPLATGSTLVITSDVPVTQSTEITNSGGFYPKVLNTSLDKLTILIQQALVTINRAVRMPLTATSTATLPVPEPLGLIGFSADASSLVLYQPDDVGLGIDAYRAATMAELRAISTAADGDLAILRGYHEDGDGGGGHFYWDASSVVADDYGITIAADGVVTGRWVRRFHGPINAAFYGLIGDGITENNVVRLNNASRAALASAYAALYIPAGHYILSGTFRFDTSITIFGDGVKTILEYTGNSPVMASRNYYSAEATSPAGNTFIRNLYLLGGSSAGANNHGILLRDYYSTILDVLITSTGGDGIRIWHKNDAGASVGGSLVENRILRSTIRGSAGYCLYLGEDDNNRITDGYINGCVLSSTATTPNHVRIGSSAGWQIDGVHTYGASAPSSYSIYLLNSYHTIVSNVYIETFGGHAIVASKTQRSISFSNIHVKNSVSGAAAILINKSSLVTSCEASVDGLHVVNAGAYTVTGIATLSAAVTVRVGSNCSFVSTGSGSIVKFSAAGAGVITYVGNAIVDGALRESSNRRALIYQGMALSQASGSYFSASNPAISIASSFGISGIGDYQSVMGTVHINSRKNHDSTRRCVYVGQVYVQAKVNGVDAWVVEMDTIVAPSGFAANPAATIADNGDGTGTLTVTFTPNDTDGYGSVKLILSPAETVQ